MSNVPVSVLESFCVLLTLEIHLWETKKFHENEVFERKIKKLQNATSSSIGADIATSQLDVQPFTYCAVL